jgi:hypothetical protein
MNGEAMEKNVLFARTSPDYLAITREIVLKHVDSGVFCIDIRRAESGDGVVAHGRPGMVACRRALPTAEAVG